MNYQAIIFDFFGVFAPDVYPEWLKKYIPDSLERMNYFLDLAQGIDQGTVTREEFLQTLGKESGQLPEEVQAQLDGFEVYPSMFSLAKKLSETYQVALLCNASSKIVDPLIEKQGFKEFCDPIIFSSDVGVAKPQPEIYELMLARLNVPAGQTIFIDDRESNIKGAQKVGIKGIHFHSFDQLVQDLAELGITQTQN
jgi:HAD superfamily hydrolase (TIGR01549 family)